MALACLQLGSYSLEAGISVDCQGLFKKRTIWRGAVFNLNAVLVTQHKEKRGMVTQPKRDGELTAAVASSPSHSTFRSNAAMQPDEETFVLQGSK